MGLSTPRLPAGGAQGCPHISAPLCPALPSSRTGFRSPLHAASAPPCSRTFSGSPMSHLVLRGRPPAFPPPAQPCPAPRPALPQGTLAWGGASTPRTPRSWVPGPAGPPPSEVAPTHPRAGPAALRPALPEPPLPLPVYLVPFKILRGHFSVYCVLCTPHPPPEGRFLSTAPGGAWCLVSTQKVFAA